MSSEMPERTPDARAAKKEIVQPKRQNKAAENDFREESVRLKLKGEEPDTAEPRRDIDRQEEP